MLQTVKNVILGFLGFLVSTSALAQCLLKTNGMLHKKVKHPGFFADWSRRAAAPVERHQWQIPTSSAIAADDLTLRQLLKIGFQWGAIMMDRKLFVLAAIITFLMAAQPVTGQWHQTDSPWGGQCAALFAVPPTASHPDGVILAGLNDHGIYRSTDHGETWMRSSTDLGQGFPEAFACQHTSTMAQNPLIYAVVSKKIYSSGDDGDTWQECAALPGSQIIQALTTTTDSTGAEIVLVGTRTGVYRSVDNGVSWAAANDGIENPWIAAFSNYIPPAPGKNPILFTATGTGIYRSLNGGASWKPRNSGAGRFSMSYLIVDPSSPSLNSLRLCGAASSGGTDLYFSDDGGLTWRWEYVNIRLSSLNAMIPVTAADGAVSLFAADDRHVYRSNDLGHTWTATDTTAWQGPIETLCVDASGKKNGRLFAGHSSQGIYFSDDAGLSWNHVVRGLSKLRIYQITHMGPALYVATFGYGLFRSEDLGDTWEDINRGIDYSDIRSQARLLSGADTLTALFATGVYRSIDKGDHWQQIYSSNKNISTEKYASVTAESPVNAVYHFLASSYSATIYRNTNRFDGWQLVKNGFGPNISISDMIGLDGRLLVATYDSQIFSSEDLGVTWTLRDSLPSGYDVRDFEVMEVNGEKLLLAAVGYAGFYLSRDYGETWTVSKIGLASVALSNLATSHPFIFAGSSEIHYGHRLYMSSDLGASWSGADEGAETITPILLHVAPVDAHGNKMLYMGTANDGIWRRPLSQFLTHVETGANDTRPADFLLLHNYPNPFNGQTVIRYHLPAPGQVSLAVYDILGKKVATLVDGQQGAGEQKVIFSAADRPLATGIYYAVLTSSSAKKIIKMVLMQ